MTLCKKEIIRKAAFELAQQEGWRWLTSSKVSDQTGIKEGKIKNIYPTKYELIFHLIDDMNKFAINSKNFSIDDSLHDKLFDLLMARFDFLYPYKSTIQLIVSDSSNNPQFYAKLLIKLKESMTLTLRVIGVQVSGWQGRLKIRGISLVYINSFRVWLNDESLDSGQTMATLNSGLEKANSIASFFDRK